MKNPPTRNPLVRIANRVRASEKAMLGLILISILLLRLPITPTVVCNVDEGIYFTIANQIVKGDIPYRDVWEQKGPVLFYAFAPVIWLFGQDIAALRIYGDLIILATMFFAYKSARLFTDRNAALLAPLFLGLFFLTPEYDGRCINGEVIMLLPLSISYYLFLRYALSEPGKPYLPLLAGVFSAIAAATKQTAALSAAAIPATMIVSLALQRKGGRETVRGLVAFLVGAALAGALIVSYFFANGAGEDMAFVYEYNVRYMNETLGSRVGAVSATLYQNLTPGGPIEPLQLLAFICLAYMTWAGGLKKGYLPATFLVISLLFSLAGVSAGGKNFRHYYQQLSVSLALIVAYAACLAALKPKLLETLLACAILYLLAIGGINAILYILSPPPMESPVSAVSKYVKERTGENDSILVTNNDAAIYFLSDRRPSMKYLNFFYLVGPEYFDLDRVAAEMERNRPAYIIAKNMQPPLAQAPISMTPLKLQELLTSNGRYGRNSSLQYLRNGYRFENATGGYVIFKYIGAASQTP